MKKVHKYIISEITADNVQLNYAISKASDEITSDCDVCISSSNIMFAISPQKTLPQPGRDSERSFG